MRLKYTEVKSYRLEQLARQNNCCGLCGELIEDDAVLDHSHKSGKIRRVLHRGCNSMLGKIENNMPRSRIDITRLQGITDNLINYLNQDYEDLIHPTHKVKKK